MKANLLEQIQLLAHTAGEFLKDGAKRAGGSVESAVLRSKLLRRSKELEDEIDLQFAEIGALIYATHTGTPSSSEDIQEILTYVDSLFEELEGHEKQLLILDGIQFCPVCGGENAPENSFCQECGKKLKEEAPAEEAPVEEAPVEEAPVEEIPVEEIPAEREKE